jgi:hypothetical protein
LKKHSVAAFAAVSAALVAPAAGSAHGATSCPKLLPLEANSIGPAAAAALAADPAKNKPQVMGATIATQDAARGSQAKTQCGSTVWRRTVVVYLTDRALLPAESAAQRVEFVGRSASGYVIWQRVH